MHLHPTHFRFEQQDGSFPYNSEMKVIIEHIRAGTVPHDLIEELWRGGVQWYEGIYQLGHVAQSVPANHRQIVSSFALSITNRLRQKQEKHLQYPPTIAIPHSLSITITNILHPPHMFHIQSKLSSPQQHKLRRTMAHQIRANHQIQKQTSRQRVRTAPRLRRTTVPLRPGSSLQCFIPLLEACKQS